LGECPLHRWALPFNNKHRANIMMKLNIAKSTRKAQEEEEEEGSYNYF
jgi:hypothetical protein